MGRKLFVLLIAVIVTLYSCKNNGERNGNNDLDQSAVMQQKDGTISLDVEKADTYHDIKNPESNTAEWSIMVSKSGRYNVWLSSATKDTTNLQYNSSVMLSIADDRLEVHPAIDKVILNSSDVSYPYYKTDSFIGSLFLQEKGLYNVQVISDKIFPESKGKGNTSNSQATKLLSVSLTPVN